MFIVIDSNIWISELGLSTHRGLALQFYAKHCDAVIAIPEIVKREVEIHTKQLLEKHIHGIENSYEQLLSVFGEMKEVVLPNENDIDTCIENIFSKVTAETKLIPLSIDSAIQANDKVILGIPPSGPKNQQFKDGVIWADCMVLLDEDDVVLITKDKGFYRDRNYRSGLATNLQEEVAEHGNQFHIHSSLTELIQKIHAPIDIDKNMLAQEFVGETEESFNRLLDHNGFEISGEPKVDVSLYVTEDTNKLYIDFVLKFDCIDVTEKDRSDAVLTLQGDAMYEPAVSKITEIRRKGESLDFIDSEGEQQRKNIVIMVGTAVLGHRTVERVVRHKLLGEDT